jgi:kumamolisin
MSADRSAIPGSERSRAAGVDRGPEAPDGVAEVSIYLRRPEAAAAHGPGQHTTRAQLRTERAAKLQDQISRVERFARGEGLSVVQSDPARRLVRVRGTIGALQSAFGTELRRFEHGGRSFRARSGPLSAPSDVVGEIEAVLGLDERPIATPKSVRLVRARAAAGFLPNAVTKIYDFPQTPGSGRGECIAIIELGGGFNPADVSAAFAAMKLPVPDVRAVAVAGGSNSPGKDDGADGEVALDIQVAGAGAPGAALAVYFAPNTDQGFVDAISQAAHDETNKPSVMSISWGSAESGWTQQAITAMNSALQDAADLGVTVLAASGDGLATDGVGDGKAHVDFPASSPYVLGCGGTRLKVSRARLSGETVWNSDGGGTGGGISDLFPVPAYQAELALPPSANGSHAGRGVPDVAGDADPNSGYRVIVDGQHQVIGGTSAVAPLWAGLFALANELAGRPSGLPHARLYSHPEAFHDITGGDNKAGDIGYAAAPGWDACTGLGSPKGSAIAAVFAS